MEQSILFFIFHFFFIIIYYILFIFIIYIFYHVIIVKFVVVVVGIMIGRTLTLLLLLLLLQRLGADAASLAVVALRQPAADSGGSAVAEAAPADARASLTPVDARARGSPPRIAFADPLGRAEFADVEAGAYVLDVVAAGVEYARYDVAVSTDAAQILLRGSPVPPRPDGAFELPPMRRAEYLEAAASLSLASVLYQPMILIPVAFIAIMRFLPFDKLEEMQNEMRGGDAPQPKLETAARALARAVRSN